MINPNTNYEYLTDDEIQILQQCPYPLTLSIDELTKSAIKNRLALDKPPRPQNSWIIFRRDYEAYLRCRSPGIKQEVKRTAQACSMKWRHLSNEDKFFFKILEKIACANHKRIYPHYKYNPKNAKTSNFKRFIFREQKKYPFTSSSPKLPKPNSMGIKSSSPPLKQVMNTPPSMINANSTTLLSTINDDTSLIFDTNDTDIISTTHPSMSNANCPILPSAINNDDAALLIDADGINTMSIQPAIRASIIQTTIKTLPSTLNDIPLPSTINDKASSLIDTDRISSNDRLKIMPNYYYDYYAFGEMNDGNVSNATIPNSANFQHHILSTTNDTLLSMTNAANFPTLHATNNDDASLLIDIGNINIVSTTNNTLFSMINANFPILPSTINDDTSSLIDTNGIVNDALK